MHNFSENGSWCHLPVQEGCVSWREQHKQLAPNDLAKVAMRGARIIVQPCDGAWRPHEHLHGFESGP